MTVRTAQEMRDLFRRDNPFPYSDPDEAANLALQQAQSGSKSQEHALLGHELAGLKEELVDGADINKILGLSEQS